MSQPIQSLIKKYDAPVPRYTSYPTVPYWNQTPTAGEWTHHLRSTLHHDDSTWSLYLHIPFCETLCTFCGCNTAITKDHKKEQPYVDTLLAEFETYLKLVPELKDRPCRQIHLGGGTPTFLSATELTRLLNAIMGKIKKNETEFEGSVEVDPRRTNLAQLEAMFACGIRRISLGVQDFNPEVQKLVNRIQPFEMTKKMTEDARRLGYKSVNFDLIYGLAKQTLESFKETIQQTLTLKPDRIALYSFALVPWIKPAQRLFKDEDLPEPSLKRALYEMAREKLISGGYQEIGMDHFARPQDGLALALKTKKLHRNFMGYTDQRTDVLLGLGVSSISETPHSFHQNEKVLNLYEEQIKSGALATFRGHVLTDEDKQDRAQILQFMTLSEVLLKDHQLADAKEFLKEMLDDGLVKIEGNLLKLADLGRPFLRNACLFFDRRYRTQKPEARTFSQSI